MTVCALLVSGVFVLGSLPAIPAPSADDIEARVLRALEGEKEDLWSAVSAEIHALSEAERRKLAVRVREGMVEFHFRGRFPGQEFSPSGLEYVVGPPGKEYETVLVVKDEELARLQRLGKSFERFMRSRKVSPVEVTLAWEEAGEVHVENLRDILGLATPSAREEFLNGMRFTESGLGKDNVRGDPSRLPKRAGMARVIVGIRLGKPVGEK